MKRNDKRQANQTALVMMLGLRMFLREHPNPIISIITHKEMGNVMFLYLDRTKLIKNSLFSS